MSSLEEFANALKDVVSSKRVGFQDEQKRCADGVHAVPARTKLYNLSLKCPVCTHSTCWHVQLAADPATPPSTKHGFAGDSQPGNSATFLLKLEAILEGLFRDMMGSVPTVLSAPSTTPMPSLHDSPLVPEPSHLPTLHDTPLHDDPLLHSLPSSPLSVGFPPSLAEPDFPDTVSTYSLQDSYQDSHLPQPVNESAVISDTHAGSSLQSTQSLLPEAPSVTEVDVAATVQSSAGEPLPGEIPDTRHQEPPFMTDGRGRVVWSCSNAKRGSSPLAIRSL
ncbi:hypothetical protein V8E53_005187 [Lactarius tabidus]